MQMKASSILRLKGIQVARWGRRIGCSSGGSAAAVCFRKREEMECRGGGGGPYFLRQLICRLKSQWKQLALRRERSSSTIALYSYDIRSYSQNFDEEMHMQMGRDLWLFLAIASLLTTGLAGGGEYWNILKYQNKKHMQQSAVLGDNNLKKYCESWRMNVEVNNIRGFDVVPQECIDHIGKYMTSSQYKSDSERTMEESSLYLSSHFCNFKGDGKDAWIFDIDDTLLSTLPYFKKHQFGGEKLNETCLEGWMRETKAPALEHTLQLYHEIRGKGIKIFLISSRREPLRDATVDNLIKVGYHGWTSLVLRGLEDEYKEVQSYKAEARKRLVEEGYRIWGIIGDQWSSFDGLPAAKRTFKLPNSLYYVS